MQFVKKEVNKQLITKNFFKTLLVLAIATVIALLLVEASEINDNVFGVYVLAVVVVSRITSGFFWGIVSSVAGVIGVNYFFTFPYHAFDFTRSGYPITFLLMLVVSFITSAMTVQILDQVRLSEEKERRAMLLYEINKHLLATNGREKIVQMALEYLNKFFQCSIVFYSNDPEADKDGILKTVDENDINLFRSEKERFTTHMVFVNKKKAGRGTDALTKSEGVYVPVISHDQMLGVIGVLCHNASFWTEETVTFLDTLVSQIALALERQELSDKQHNIFVETEKEKMRSNLLRAVSHDLRTPLTCILGASATLLENKNMLEEDVHDKLIHDIHEDSKWLIHMVENLLLVTRISEETATVRKSPEAVEEILGEAVIRVKSRYPGHDVLVQVPNELLMVPMDATLIEQVIINLVENAFKHSYDSSPVEIIVSSQNRQAIFQISDNGKGLIESDIPNLFDGCSTNQNKSSDSSRGMGIGLSICKSIISAHNGSIRAFNKASGGAVFEFTLPI